MAISKEDGKKYFIKTIKKGDGEDAAGGEDYEKFFWTEAKSLIKLSHPNIVKLVSILEDEKNFYQVLEYVDGTKLFTKILEYGAYRERDAVRIVRQIVTAISYLHASNIVHRNLKPENILCTGNGRKEIVKITGFFFATNVTSNGKMLTQVGSAGYAAPEVIQGKEYDKNVDIWSLGVIVYILLYGDPPFYSDRQGELLKLILDCNLNQLKYGDEVSEEGRDFVKHLLVKNPAERYTAEQCLKHSWLQKKRSKRTNLPRNDKMLTTSYTKLKQFIETATQRQPKPDNATLC